MHMKATKLKKKNERNWVRGTLAIPTDVIQIPQT